MNSFFKYKNSNTIVHKLDCRVKLLALIVLMVIIFLTYGSKYQTLVIYSIAFLFTIVLSIISKSNFLQVIRRFKALSIMLLLILILNVFFSNDSKSEILFIIPFFNNFEVRIGPLINFLFTFSRLIIVLILSNVFTSTSKPMEIADAFEFYLTPLKLIKIPVSKLALSLSLALRFIPTLQDEASRIKDSQASRLVDYKNGKLKEKIQSLSSLIIPLFISSFEKSGQLGDALSSRGYSPYEKRSKYKKYKFSAKDFITLFILALILSSLIFLKASSFDLFEYFKIGVPTL